MKTSTTTQQHNVVFKPTEQHQQSVKTAVGLDDLKDLEINFDKFHIFEELFEDSTMALDTGDKYNNYHCHEVEPSGITCPLLHEVSARCINMFGQAEEYTPDDLRIPDAFQAYIQRAGKIDCWDAVGLMCGPTTNLRALCIRDTNAVMLPFLLAMNPWLRKTIWTAWRGFHFAWLRMEGECPNNQII